MNNDLAAAAKFVANNVDVLVTVGDCEGTGISMAQSISLVSLAQRIDGVCQEMKKSVDDALVGKLLELSQDFYVLVRRLPASSLRTSWLQQIEIIDGLAAHFE